MVSKQILFALVTFLHDLFTAVWIGGLIALGLTVLPATKQVLGTGPQTKRLTRAIQRRLSVLVYVSIVGLLVTGALQANRSSAFQGLFSFGNTYSTLLAFKHLLVLTMIVVALVRSLALGRASAPSSPTRERLNAALLFLNIGLGVLVLLVTGFVVAFSSGGPPT